MTSTELKDLKGQSNAAWNRRRLAIVVSIAAAAFVWKALPIDARPHPLSSMDAAKARSDGPSIDASLQSHDEVRYFGEQVSAEYRNFEKVPATNPILSLISEFSGKRP